MTAKASHRQSREKFYSIPNISSDQLILPDGLKNFAFCVDNEPLTIVNPVPDTVIDCSAQSTTSSSPSSAILFRHSFRYYFWRFSMGFLIILFGTLCCYTVYQFKIQHLHSYQQLRNLTLENQPKICQLFQSKLNLYYKIPANYVSLGLLLLLIVLLVFFQNVSYRKQRTFKSFWQHLSMPMIFNSHSHLYVSNRPRCLGSLPWRFCTSSTSTSSTGRSISNTGHCSI